MGSENTHVYTDNTNLLFIFHPTALEPSLGRHIISKVQRWVLFLSQLAYHIEHISGEKNLMADMMTRWVWGYLAKRHVTQMARRVKESTNLELTDESSDWPSTAEIREAQNTFYMQDIPKDEMYKNGVHVVNGRASIPSGAYELQLRAMALAKCVENGPRGVQATAASSRSA